LGKKGPLDGATRLRV